MKSYKRQNLIVAAIRGKQQETAEMLLSYRFILEDKPKKKESKAKKLKIWGKDEDDNNMLHHCGLNAMHSIEAMILKHHIYKPAEKIKQKMKFREQFETEAAKNKKKDWVKERDIAFIMNRKGLKPGNLKPNRKQEEVQIWHESDLECLSESSFQAMVQQKGAYSGSMEWFQLDNSQIAAVKEVTEDKETFMSSTAQRSMTASVKSKSTGTRQIIDEIMGDVGATMDANKSIRLKDDNLLVKSLD